MKSSYSPGLRRPLLALFLLALFIFVNPVAEPALGQVSADRFAGMPARSIGPTGNTGRISAIDAVVADPNVVFVGAAPGGVWKSVNGGQTWRAVFDDQPVSTIASIAINQANPDIVWVGVGEVPGRERADPSASGVYRSLDGGDSWAGAGLLGIEGVHRILLHPSSPEIVYAGVSGVRWEDGAGPGVYKTTDGGQSWIRVLFVDERTGVSDLVMDPRDPERLLAAMWSTRAYPWSVVPRGPGSGLFLTRDGGESWIRLTEEDGLPAGELGRIALDVFGGNPRVVHALVDAGEGVLLRSTDRGRTWRTVRRGPHLMSALDEPNDIVADPVNGSRLYLLSSRFSVSDDGGESFLNGGRGSRPGFRVLWIHPGDPRLLYGGTDHGPYVSRDAGEHWAPLGRLPLGRFNHASVDMAVPFNVYGGLERNGSWVGSAYGWAEGGARNRDWMELGSDDGFTILVDPVEASRGYAVAPGGDLVRFDIRTGERKAIRPWAPDIAELRFNRDTPIALDPHEAEGIYFGSQFVHRSGNRGGTWQIISGDLTANDPAGRREDRRDASDAGGFGPDAESVDGPEEPGGATITVIAPSPVDRDVIWVGTDEGDVQVTRSAGGEWESVRRRIGSVPDSAWVTHIEPSVFRPGSAYVAFDAHRTGNRESLIFSTDNYGRSWRRLARGADIEGVVHTLEQDPIVEDLLFAGTEAGLYVSLNRGEDWIKWTHGLPPVPVRDLVLHPRDHDLVIATHGRAAYVLDDIRPLRELARNPEGAELELFLFEPPPAFIRATPAPVRDDRPAGDAVLRGQDRPFGALLTYWLGASPNEDRGDRGDGEEGVGEAGEESRVVTIEILDFEGRVVRTFSGPAVPGVNRIAWDLREDPPTLSGPLGEFSDAPIGANDGGFPSADVLPGSFTVRISSEGAESVRMLEVRTDARVEIEMVERIAKYQAVKRGLNLDARLRALRAAVASVHAELQRVSDLVGARGFAGDAELLETGQSLVDELRELTDFRGVMRYHLGVLGLGSSYDAPTEGQRLDLIRMEEELDRLLQRIGDFLILDINRFARRVYAAGVEVSFFIGPIG
ncbi:MAG: hypothetical protein IIC36_04720 [Gemmatimonadetes bacterium]|nr:hypothetical protein [Gemmatimonadota bacterium]